MSRLFEDPCVEPIDGLPRRLATTALDAAMQICNKAEDRPNPNGMASVQKLVEFVNNVIAEAVQRSPVMYPSQPCPLYLLDWAAADMLCEEMACNLKDITTVDQAFQRSLQRAEKIRHRLESVVDLTMDDNDYEQAKTLCLKIASLASMYSGPRIRR